MIRNLQNQLRIRRGRESLIPPESVLYVDGLAVPDLTGLGKVGDCLRGFEAVPDHGESSWIRFRV
jgi:hypothetical protein